MGGILLVPVNGYLVDIRRISLEVQRQAFEKGVISYVSDDREDST